MPHSEKVAIFIDGSNFYHGVVSVMGRADVNFETFAAQLCAGRNLLRSYYYNAQIDQRHDPKGFQSQQRFLGQLYRTPYLEVRLGRLVYRNGVAVGEKGVDVRIATDMLSLASRGIFDTAILVSGDGDFVDAVRAVKDLGRHVENAYFTGSQSFSLLQVCDKSILLDQQFLQTCLLR